MLWFYIPVHATQHCSQEEIYVGAKVKLHNIKDTDHISGDSIVQYQCHFQTKDKLLDILYDM